MFKSLIYRIKALFIKEKEAEIVSRDEFAQEVKAKFKGNTELLQAIEKGMNKYAKKDEYVSLAD